MRLKLATVPGIVLIIVAATLWGLDALIRKPLAATTVPTTIVFGEHVILVALTVVSLRITHATIHQANGFSWFPILEVAKLFAGLFITIIPAIAILRAGTGGALGGWIDLVTDPDGQPIPAMYFWMTGLLSTVLDNAPTYLMFFNTAGGDAEQLMGPLAATLAAISAGAVFMGANTYVGNAPNFMVKSICEQYGIRMPSFFGYMLWSLGILTPLYIVLTFLFFR